MMMDGNIRCPVARDLLPGYIDGLLSPESSALVSAHLAECEACRAAHRAMACPTPAPEAANVALLQRLAARRRKRRLRAWVIAALALAALAVCLLPWPRRLRAEHGALEWRCGESAYERPRSVQIDGTYLDYLFREDTFSGTLAIEGYPQTQARALRVRFYDGNMGALYYENDSGLLQSFGFLLLAPDGREFLIGVYEDSHWSGEDGLVITSPAENRAQAVENANAIAKRLNPDWLGGGKPLE